MKIFISPAKKLTVKNMTISNATKIQFFNETKYLINQLRNYSIKELKDLMGLSDNLAILNYERFQKWDLQSKEVNLAIYMFEGDVYKGLKANYFSEDELDFAQDHLRIISGLYGLLRPFDLIFPYRLEMGTKLKNKHGNNLYDFWGKKLVHSLLSEMEGQDLVINLASNEYSKVLKFESLNKTVVTPVFKDYKNGKLKVISFFAKNEITFNFPFL